MSDSKPGLETATFGAGCFWCVEAVFQSVDGVDSVESGYAGGSVPSPTYEQVCGGDTGPAEVCRVRFDPAMVAYEKLLEIFWKTHDPTTLNRQGNDVGTQYRSVIFTHNDRQRAKAEEIRKKLDASGAWGKPIVTQILPAPEFHRAEEYHQDYYARNPAQGYCRFVIAPKVEKFREVFPEAERKGGR